MFINVICNTKALETWEMSTYRDLLQLLPRKRILCDILKNNHCLISGAIHLSIGVCCHYAQELGRLGMTLFLTLPNKPKLCSLDWGDLCCKATFLLGFGSKF